MRGTSLKRPGGFDLPLEWTLSIGSIACSSRMDDRDNDLSAIVRYVRIVITHLHTWRPWSTQAVLACLY